MQTETSTNKRNAGSSRRGFIARGLALAFAAIGAVAARAEEALAPRPKMETRGEPLKREVWQGEPPVEPLDTMIHFRRSDSNTGRAMTHEVLSLSHEEKGPNSYPWTIYAHLDTHHEQGDACVLCSRLHKYGPGWSTGLHSEVFAHNRAVALGVNVEMFNDYKGTEPTQVYGVNVQSIASSPNPGDTGVNIHGPGGWKKAINIDSKGDVAIDINGEFKTGIDMHKKDVKLGEGGCVVLDDAGEIRIRYRSGVIEFLRKDVRFAHLKVEGEDRAL